MPKKRKGKKKANNDPVDLRSSVNWINPIVWYPDKENKVILEPNQR